MSSADDEGRASDLAEARRLEMLRYMETLERLNEEEKRRVAEQDRKFAARGMYQSGARMKATLQARLDKIEALLTARIEARKDLARTVRELASPHELDALMSDISRTLDHVQLPPGISDPPDPLARKALESRTRLETEQLRACARNRIEILKKEFALKLHDADAPRSSVSVHTGGGPALVNLGAIYGNVKQVIGKVDESGAEELAALLRQLADAINRAEDLGEARGEYLEQVQFIARQAAEPSGKRQVIVIKAVLVALRSTLQDAANAAQVLGLVGPAIARHFQIAWPF